MGTSKNLSFLEIFLRFSCDVFLISHKNVKTYQKNSLSALLMWHLLKTTPEFLEDAQVIIPIIHNRVAKTV